MRSLLIASVILLEAAAASAQGTAAVAQNATTGEMGLFTPSAIRWQDGPPSLRKGARMVVLEGNPAVEGMFTMRLWFPDGFEVAPHWHSQIEHVTIVSGILNFGMGEKFDRSATRAMPAGSFGFWPIGMKHFAWTTGETVLQLHGRGPWTVTYVNPADDPRQTR
jgi:hypothetical protein